MFTQGESMRMSIAIVCSILFTSAVAGADNITLGIPTYGGTGCPAGSASVNLSPDSSALSILFDQYVAQAGGAVGFDRKNCNIAVPVHVPQGFSVSVFAIDYRGFMGLPQGGRAQLNVNYFLAGDGQGFTTSKTFVGPLSTDYFKTDSLNLQAVVWSACGADTLLRANTTMLLRSNAHRDQAMSTVDSADIKAGIIYHLQWRSCP